MKIILIGKVRFSKSILTKLIELNANIVGVITRHKNSLIEDDGSDLSDIAFREKIPVLMINRAFDESINTYGTINWVKELKPDYIFCVGWPEIIGPELLAIPRKGIIGYHPSPLPIGRGRHPLIWALALGLPETASTFFMMDRGVDSGDIIAQSTIRIKNTDDAGSLYRAMTKEALSQLASFWPSLMLGKLEHIKQEYSKATYWRKRSPALDGAIDWRMYADSIYDLVRALSKPYSGATFIHAMTEGKVWRVTISRADEHHEPGKILEVSPAGQVKVKAGQGAIWLLDYTWVHGQEKNLPTFKKGSYLG